MRLRSGWMIEEKKQHTFDVSESKVRHSEPVSSDSVSYEDVKVEMTTLRELAKSNLKTQPLSITY